MRFLSRKLSGQQQPTIPVVTSIRPRRQRSFLPGGKLISGILIGGYIVFCFALSIATIIVAAHFIAKFW